MHRLIEAQLSLVSCLEQHDFEMTMRALQALDITRQGDATTKFLSPSMNDEQHQSLIAGTILFSLARLCLDEGSFLDAQYILEEVQVMLASRDTPMSRCHLESYRSLREIVLSISKLLLRFTSENI